MSCKPSDSILTQAEPLPQGLDKLALFSRPNPFLNPENTEIGFVSHNHPRPTAPPAPPYFHAGPIGFIWLCLPDESPFSALKHG